MRRQVVLLFALALICSLPAFAADFSGHWTGKGSLVSRPDGQTLACDFDFTIAHTPATLTVGGGYTCQGFGYNVSTTTFDLRGGSIFMNGQHIGSINDGGFHMTFNNGYYVDMIGVQKIGDKIQFAQAMRFVDGTGIDVAGELSGK